MESTFNCSSVSSVRSEQCHLSDVESGSYCILCQVVAVETFGKNLLLIRIRDGTFNKELSTSGIPFRNQIQYGVNISVTDPANLTDIVKVGQFYAFSNVTFSKTKYGFLQGTLSGPSAFALKFKKSHPLVIKMKRKIQNACRKKFDNYIEELKKKDYFDFLVFGVKSYHPVIEYGEEEKAMKRNCSTCNSWWPHSILMCQNISCENETLSEPQFHFSFLFWATDIEIEAFLYGQYAEKFFSATPKDVLSSHEHKVILHRKLTNFIRRSSPGKMRMKWNFQSHFIIFKTIFYFKPRKNL